MEAWTRVVAFRCTSTTVNKKTRGRSSDCINHYSTYSTRTKKICIQKTIGLCIRRELTLRVGRAYIHRIRVVNKLEDRVLRVISVSRWFILILFHSLFIIIILYNVCFLFLNFRWAFGNQFIPAKLFFHWALCDITISFIEL